jgi:hypothetical protein
MNKITAKQSKLAGEKAHEVDERDDKTKGLAISDRVKRWYWVNVVTADPRKSLHEVADQTFDEVGDLVWEAINAGREELE